MMSMHGSTKRDAVAKTKTETDCGQIHEIFMSSEQAQYLDAALCVLFDQKASPGTGARLMLSIYQA